MRYVIIGAGAVGGSVGALLHEAGRSVCFVARGAHGAEVAARGLLLRRPGRPGVRLRIPTVDGPEALDLAPGDVAVLATKLQDAAGALDALRRRCGLALPVLCATNGVAAESMATRRGFRAYGGLVWVHATHLTPGEVWLHGAAPAGVLDVGCAHGGADPGAAAIAADLRAAGFEAEVRADIMAWKRAKLLTNARGVLQALVASPSDRLGEAVEAEGQAALDASGLPSVPRAVLRERAARVACLPIDGRPRPGGSAWQSVARGSTSEVDFLCGELVLLGETAGTSTPVNRIVQRAMHRLCRAGGPPGRLSEAELWAEMTPASVRDGR